MIGKTFGFVGLILSPLKKPAMRLIVLPLFGFYIAAKNRVSKRATTFRDKVILIFTNRYIIHIIVVLIALGVSSSNILAYETREDYGKGALVNKIIGIDTYETVEDNPATDEFLVNSYVGDNGQLTRNILNENQQQEEDLNNQDSDSYLATSQGGSTLIKPDIVDTADAAGQNKIKSYVVTEGDTIGSIARKFAISIDTVLWANNLTAQSFIKPGQILTISPVTGVLHKIVRGDTIAKIAQKYQADANRVQEFNHLDNKLVAGETLIVPDGKIIYTQRPRQYNSQPTPTTRTQTARVDDDDIVATGRMMWPDSCHRISQYFKGWRHTGVDIACPWGVNIYAADSGVVSRVQYGKTGYGYNVIINHGGGKQTLYGHLSRILVTAGQTVSKGDVIGLEGSTGRSTGPHLHFEVRVNGVQINPLGYIR